MIRIPPERVRWASIRDLTKSSRTLATSWKVALVVHPRRGSPIRHRRRLTTKRYQEPARRLRRRRRHRRRRHFQLAGVYSLNVKPSIRGAVRGAWLRYADVHSRIRSPACQ